MYVEATTESARCAPVGVERTSKDSIGASLWATERRGPNYGVAHRLDVSLAGSVRVGVARP